MSKSDIHAVKQRTPQSAASASGAQYGGLDRFRVAAAFLVVAVHTSPLTSFSLTADFLLTRSLGRLAVPFFLMASGFFLFSQSSRPPGQQEGPDAGRLAAFEKKGLRLYLVAVLMYLPVNVYSGYFSEPDLPGRLIRDLLFHGTLYHLWYLPAVMLGAALVFLMLKLMRARSVLIAVSLLYLAGLAGDSYWGLTTKSGLLRNIYEGGLFQLFDYTRNGLFLAPVFLLFGALIARQRYRPLLRYCTTGFVLTLTLMMVEGLLLHFAGWQRHDSMYLFLPLCLYFLFEMLLHVRSASSAWLRSFAMIVYLIHPLILIAVRGMAKVTGLRAFLVDNSLVHYLTVCLGSAVCAALFLTLQRVVRRRAARKEGAG